MRSRQRTTVAPGGAGRRRWRALRLEARQNRDMAYASHLRCSDADRDRAAGVLRDSLGEGRIDLVELDERLDQIYQAKTYGDLTSAMADLPAWSPPAPPEVPAGSPMPVTPGWGRPASSFRQRRVFLWVAALCWLLWLTATATNPHGGGPGILLLVPVVWGYALLSRARRRRSYRRVPPPSEH